MDTQEQITLTPAQSAWLADTFARRREQFGGWRMEGDGTDGAGGDGDGGSGGDGGKPATFTQADIDAAVDKAAAKIRADERRKVSAQYADYGDLKKAAEGKKSADERIAELEQKHAAAEARALRADIASRHGISTEDRDLFLTATDEEGLEAQAKRLAERESERKKQSNRVPREGRIPATGANDEREAVRSLFGTGG